MSTDQGWYAERLAARENVWWKRLLDVQRPYRNHLRRLALGYVLDVGCGVGRNLLHLGGASAGVGVDHNAQAVAIARERGVVAYLPAELRGAPGVVPGRFDSLLLSHVAEHMREAEAAELLSAHLDLVRPGGRVVVLGPQEAGFRSDPTHVEFMDFERVARFLATAACEVTETYSFPFPRFVGRFFKYNEFVVLARRQ